MPQQIKQIAIVGCGWLGTPLAYHLLGLGYGVRGTRQHTSSRIELAQAGVIEGALSVTPELHCDVSEKIFGGCDLLIINIPPNRKAHDRHYHVTQIQSLAQAAVNYQIPKVLFIGSTSVYGPMQGEVTCGQPPGGLMGIFIPPGEMARALVPVLTKSINRIEWPWGSVELKETRRITGLA